MSDAITAIARSMNADLVHIRAAGQNVANTNTHGYLSVRFMPETAGSQDARNAPLREHVALDPGALQSTGRSLDFAIAGNAFFAVLTPDGVRYTRAGSFHLDATGQLLSAGGHPVLGETGPVLLQDASVSTDLNGDIYQQGERLDRLVLVAPGSAVKSAGNNLYDFLPAASSSEVRVHQGMLEASNVNVTNEMVRLIEHSRHLETVQRAMSTYDRMLDIGINQLGSRR